MKEGGNNLAMQQDKNDNDKENNEMANRKALVLLSHLSERAYVCRLCKRIAARGCQVLIISLLPPEELGWCTDARLTSLRDIINDSPCIIDLLAKETCAASDRLLSALHEVLGEQAHFRGVSLWSCLLPEISYWFLQPLIQAVWAFDYLLASEEVTEVWVPSSAKWPFSAPILEGRGPEWLAYNNLLSILLARVASSRQIPIRFYRLSTAEMASYVVTKFLRGVAFEAYRSWRWLQKTGASQSSLKRASVVEMNQPIVMFLIRSIVGLDRIGVVCENLGRSKPVLLFDQPLGATFVYPTDGEVALEFVGRRLYFRTLIRSVPIYAKTWRALAKLGSLEFSFQQVPYNDLLRSFLRAYIRELTEVMTYIEATERVVQQLRPKLCVVENDRSIAGQATVRTAMAHGVTTLLVQHGLIADPPVQPHIAQYVAVPTWRDAQILLKWGFPKENLAVAGLRCTSNDVQRIGQRNQEEQLPMRVASARCRPTIGVLSGPLSVRTTMAQIATDVVVSGVGNVLFKVHPTENPSYYTSLLKQTISSGKLTLLHTVNIGDVLAAINVLISYESTAVVEAMMLGIPCLVIPVPGRWNVVTHPIFLGHPGLASSQSIVRRLTEIVGDTNIQRRFLEEQALFLRNFLTGTEHSIWGLEQLLNKIRRDWYIREEVHP